LLLLLHPHRRRIGFCLGQWVTSKYIFDLFHFLFYM
jgi:hypothetical protein